MTPENYKLIYKFMKKSLHQCLWSRHKEKRRIGMMKQLLILGVVLVLSGFNTVFAQEVKFNFQMKNATLEDLFKKVERNSEYRFIYPVDDLKDFAKFDVDVKDLTISQVLDKYLKNFNLEYKFDNKYIIIYKKQKKNGTVKDTKIIAVSGRVTDKDGLPLPGTSIFTKGTIKGTTTDANGNYAIKVPEGSVLVFSFVGFQKQEIVIPAEDTEINVNMKEMAMELGEVVISTGYQTLKKSTVAGSISSIKAEELTFDGVKTLEQTLQGKLPGLVIINNSGLVGTRQKTIVRGVSTLTGTQEPLWVVDGVIQSDPLPFKATTINNLGQITPDNFDYVRNFVGNAIAWLNPNDIEDITVLKDASATAIYGVRAGNGVIVINTKKGKEGPMRISYSTRLNIGEKVTYNKLNLMNSKERVAVSKEIWDRGLTSAVTNNSIGYAGALNDYLFGKITYDEFNAQVKYMETVNTNWFDILFRNPVSTSHSLSVSGGSANTRYYGSFGYNKTNGTAIGNDTKGFNASFGLNTQLSKKLNASVRISVSEANTNGFYTNDPYTYASRINRAIPGYNEDGSDFFYAKGSGYLFNINNELANSGSSNKTLSVNANFNINYQINKDLRFTSLFGLSQSVSRGYTYATQQTEQIAILRGYDYGTALPTDEAYKNSKIPVGGIYSGDDNDNVTWNFRNSITYSHIFNGKHALIVMAGQDATSSKYTGFSSVNYGYLPERGNAFVTLPLTYTKNNTPNPYFNEEIRKSIDRLTNNMGLYLTVNYSYDNRYAFNFSVRSDASNRFGQYTGEKFNPVYAAGLRWNMANEEWIINNVKWLSMLNLRASFGYQRNIASNVSPDLIAKMPTGAPSNLNDAMTGEPRLIISSLPYGDLRWEKTSTWNFGLDFGFVNNRISGTVEYYIKKGKDLITSLSVPFEYGVTSMPINGGSLDNRGIEIGLNFIPVQSKNYTLSISFNTSKTFNTLKKTGIQNNTWLVATSGHLYKEDYPVSGFWAFDFTGIDPTNGYPTFNLDVAEGKDPVTDPTSFMKYVGKMNPDLTASLGLNFRYKMFTLSSSLYLQLGGHKFLAPVYVAANSSRTISLPLEYDNLPKEITERWTPTNTTASFPGLPDSRLTQIPLPNGVYTNYYEMYNYSTARVANASTLRVNSISISYSLPNNIVSRLKCQGINVGFTASNPFAWVSKDFKGVDAEVATGSQPRIRSYALSLSVNL